MIALRLPFTFDPARLKEDLAQIQPHEWVSHFNKSYYDGEWSGVALRSTSGEAGQIYPDPSTKDYSDTPALARTAYFREVLSTFRCEILAARLLRLKAGSRIREHRDYNLSIEDGELRVHVPIQTNPQLVFILGGERLVLSEGAAWYLNVNYPHSVDNAGDIDRIHMVFDCVVNDWLRAVVDRCAETDSGLTSHNRDLHQFIEQVLRDGLCEEELRACQDIDTFVETVMRCSSALGFRIEAGEIRALLRERSRTWSNRLL